MLALNASEVPNVGPLTRDALSALVARCDLALVARLPEDRRRSPAWCSRSRPAPTTPAPTTGGSSGAGPTTSTSTASRSRWRPAGRGVASALYDAVEERARATGRTEVTCEVNVAPRNEVSLRFHAARGFVEVGQQDVDDHRVSLQALRLR